MTEEFLKTLAGLTGSELTIYSPDFFKPKKQEDMKLEQPVVKKRGRPLGSTRQKLQERREQEEIEKRKRKEEATSVSQETEQESANEEEKEEEDDDEEFLSSEPFDYEIFASKFPTICEADFEFSKGLEQLRNEEQNNNDNDSDNEDFSLSDDNSDLEFEEGTYTNFHKFSTSFYL